MARAQNSFVAVGGAFGCEGYVGVFVDGGHESGFVLPVGFGVLDYAEGVDPDVA